MSISTIVILIEGAGGLFDFNATLPLTAVQFVLLTVLLTFIFYKPICTILYNRKTFIANEIKTTVLLNRLANKDDITFKNELETCRAAIKTNILKAKKEANEAVNAEVKNVQTRSLLLLDEAINGPEAIKVKAFAIQNISDQTDELTQFIRTKLFGK